MVHHKGDWLRARDAIEQFHDDFRQFNPRGIMLILSSSPKDEEIARLLQSLDNGDSLLYLDLFTPTAALQYADLELPFDGHWSHRLHQIVADELLAVILELKQREIAKPTEQVAPPADMTGT